MNYFFIAAQRSGHHGVMNWFVHQVNQNISFFNNCSFDDGKMLVPYEFVRYRFENNTAKEFWIRKNIWLGKKYPEKVKLAKQLFQLNDTVKIFSFEQRTFQELDESKIDQFECLDSPPVRIAIIRDPYNWLASTLRAGCHDYSDCEKLMNLWKEHAEYSLREENTTYFINFNKWFVSKQYRQDISKHFNLQFTDNGLNKVMKFGGGSSFDGQRFNGSAQKMSVLTRFESFLQHSEFKNCFSDEIVDFAETIFDIKRPF